MTDGAEARVALNNIDIVWMYDPRSTVQVGSLKTTYLTKYFGNASFQCTVRPLLDNGN